MTPSCWDVIIIGSGISSLTCAALLSKKGKSVCVLEQYSKPGGYLHCFNRFGDRFDTGAHYIGAMDRGQPFHTLLNYLGVYHHSDYVPLDPDGFDLFKFPDFQVEFPKGYKEVIKRLSDVFPTEHKAIETYFLKIKTVAQNFPTYEFNENTDISTVLPMLEKSLFTVVNELTVNKNLQSVLYSYCTLHGVAPEEVSFGLHAIVTDSLVRGPYGLTKGGDALAVRYVDSIEKLGGQVHLGKKITKIKTVGKLFTSVLTECGESFQGKWVISGIHPKATFALLSDPQVLTPAFRQRLESTIESSGIFGIYAACDTKPNLNPLKNYYYFGTRDPGEILKYSQPTSRPNAVFLCPANRLSLHSKNAFTLNIHAAGPLEWFSPWRGSGYGKRPEDYKNLKEKCAQNILNFIDDFEPSLRPSLKRYVTSTPVTNLHFNGSNEGSSYGIYHSMENTGVRSLGPRTHIANMLLTGQSCLFPGLLGAAISGLRTAGHIIGIKPILKELRESALA